MDSAAVDHTKQPLALTFAAAVRRHYKILVRRSATDNGVPKFGTGVSEHVNQVTPNYSKARGKLLTPRVNCLSY